MEAFSGRGNRHVPGRQPAEHTEQEPEEVRVEAPTRTEPAHYQPRSPRPTAHDKKSRSWRKMVVVIAVALLGLLLLGGLFFRAANPSTMIDSGKYQAIFLTNGQVYFGKLVLLDTGYYKLTDVFYLQTAQQQSDENPQKTAEDSSAQNVQLIKLGNEIHGPEDAMMIAKDQVLFFENLTKEGKVAQSIAKYESDNKDKK